MSTRRDFLQIVAAPLLALPLLDNEIACEPKENTPGDGPVLRFAILGLGGYGNIVANSMPSSKRAKLVGVISGTPSKITAWQSKFNIPEKNCYNYENFDTIKDNPDIDAVYIITPNALHKDFAIRAAKAGKHVICEKPMSVNAKDGKEMVDACKAANVKLLIGYRMHFEPTTLEVVRMRKADELGKIKFFEGLSGFRIGDPSQWRLNKKLAGGGSMMDIGIYSVNGARYMVGEEPIWVTAQETKTDPVKFGEGVDETVSFQLGFPSGAIASCLSTYNMSNLDKFFLNGDKGFVEMKPAHGYGPIRGNAGSRDISQPHVPHQARQMDEMAAIIFENKQPVIPVDGEEGLKDMKIMDAIYESLKTGEKVMLS
ncbi:MAG: Gfo/Idh/MocA family oxidoreductase [Chitinophagaceae bacterium]